ncbi:MAG: hypothetical protein DHS20C14_17470 [Phycisphaeraceae bacterium]|nr:MAG: hypothetical protein DHS20C14_17470 [Phycisphaeraceae bacterium]
MASRTTRTLLVLTALTAAVPAVAWAPPASASVTEHEMQRDQLRLRARLRTSGVRARGNADYRERVRKGELERRLKVEIERGTPNIEFVIEVDGVAVAKARTNGFGYAEVNFRTHSDNPNVIPDVPKVVSGTVISIGKLSGKMRER